MTLADPARHVTPSTFAPANFDGIARPYRWAEYLTLGPLLTRTRRHFLPQIQGAQRALLLGDGDGRFTAALLRRNPTLQAHAVDTSATMLHLLRTRSVRDGTSHRLRTTQSSALDIHAEANTDLLVTHFLLDCLTQEEIAVLAHRFATEVRPGCLWVISEFGLPRHRLLRPLAAIYIRSLYLAFRVLTGLRPNRLPDPGRALGEAGFELLARKERLGGLLYSELWQLRGAGVRSHHP